MSFAATTVTPATARQPLALSVMTFNLKFASEDGPNAWSRRRPLVAETIRATGPDVVGTQEGVFGQLRNLAADLPGYGWVGVGRNGGQQGEFSAIFYRKERFRVLEQGNFWLSSTPEVVGSRTWGNLLPRMVTWALFEDLESGAQFYHFNTHFDHLIPFARSKSAALLARRIAGRKMPVPVVVTGDFNTSQNSNAHATLVAGAGGPMGLVDTWTAAQAREGQRLSTFHNWRGPRNGGRRIDWILSTGDFVCKRSSVVTFQKDGRWPSDHFPVISELALGAPAREPMIAEHLTAAPVAMR